MNWFKISQNFTVGNPPSDVSDYMDIGHYDQPGIEEQWVIMVGADDYITADPYEDDIHINDKYRNSDFSGRIDHSRNIISITPDASIDMDRRDYVVSLLNMDYPGYKIYWMSGNKGKPERISSSYIRNIIKAQYSVDDYQPRPIPALPQNAMGVRDNGRIIEPLPITPELPKFELKFENSHEDSHSGQDDYILFARNKEDNQPLGAIEYSIFRKKVYVNNMIVKEGYRRMGIGTALINELKNGEFTEGLEIKWGMMTEEGYALNQSLEKS